MVIRAGSRRWLEWLLMFAGSGLMALAIKNVYEPQHMVTGGFTGIAIIVKEISSPLIREGIPLWFTNIALNIPLFFAALFLKGKEFIGRTAIATVLLSAWLYVLPEMDFVQGDIILAVLFGGVLMGIGFGMILMGRATTGGTDTIALLIQLKLRQYSIPRILQVIDGIVIVLGLFLFGIQPTLYAIIAVVVSGKMSDALIDGFKFSKAAFIISSRPEEVAAILMKELQRGVTALNATGMYTGDEKQVLYCVVSKKQIVDLKNLVLSIDEHAFVIVSDAREVLGEGFQEADR